MTWPRFEDGMWEMFYVERGEMFGEDCGGCGGGLWAEVDFFRWAIAEAEGVWISFQKK